MRRTSILMALALAVAPITAAQAAITYPKSTYVVPSALRGTDYTRIPTAKKVVALTFDAGANAAGHASIMKTLKAKGVKATFFLTGKWVRAYPNYSKYIRLGGHAIGNHSDTHPDFTKLTIYQQQQQIRKAAYYIKAATGAPPRAWFRFPFGARTTSNIKVANNEGYICVRWTVDTLGWKGTSGGITTSIVKSRVIKSLQPGEIVLMHVGSNPTDHSTLDADALPSLIDAIRAKGYTFTTLALLGG